MDVKEVLGLVSLLLPIGVQFLRAKRSFSEPLAVGLMAACGLAAYWLFNEGNPMTRDFWQGAVMWVLAALGVNRAASSAAHSGVAAIPVTNSQP